MIKATKTILLTAVSLTVLCGVSEATTLGSIETNALKSSAIIHVADETGEGAKQFIAKMGDRGINFLGDSSKSAESKKAEFTKLLDDSFDMKTIGRFVLGTNWKVATPAQQQEYQKLFRKMIINVYSKRFSEYNGQKFEVRTARKDGKDTTVSSFIVPSSGPEVRVDWRVREKDGKYKVVDIVVEGVSMAMTQRADFASVVERGGNNIESLLTHLRQQQ
jgi:phospholipid transport system substrate-binding protein